MESLNRFRRLSYAKHIYIEGRVIIADVPLEPGVREKLMSLKTIDGKELIVLDTQQLADDLEKFLEGIVERERDILFVFPGNGSNYPRSTSNVCKEAGGVGVYAKRIWNPGSDPFAMAGVVAPEVFMNLGLQTIVVVDDVISSGQTMYKLYRNNEWRFPRAKWIAATWVAQVPQMKACSGINGYDCSVVACVLEGPKKRRVPINSLSTLCEQAAIAESYAKRHFVDWQRLLDLLSNVCPVELF